MRSIRVLLLLLCSGACGGRAAPPVEDGADTAQFEDPDALAQRRALPPMPDYPVARRLRLVAVSAGETDTVRGSWPARATSCDQPPALEVVTQDQDVGTLILVHLYRGQSALSSYPVAAPDSGFPAPPAAQLAVQIASPGSMRAFQAVYGTVELSALDAAVSGRFAVTLREIQSHDSLRYVGTFEGIPLGPALVADCAAIAGSENDAASSPDEP